MKTLRKIVPLFAIATMIVAAMTTTTAYSISADKQSAPKPSPRISVQLWSVHKDIAKDFKGTVSALAAMGFDGIELAGDFGGFADDPEGLAAFVESKGLEISGAHVNYDALNDDNFEKTINFYKAAGVPMLLIPYDIRAGKSDTIEQTIADLNRLAPKVEAHGIRFGYHNHDFEFATYGDATFWDHIANSTSETFVLQMDVGWANFAGADPIEYVRKYPGRTLSTHYKGTLHPSAKDKLPILGQDSVNWAKLYNVNKEVGGTLWVVVEQEEYPNGLSPLEAVKLSKQGLDEALAQSINPN